MKRHSAERAIRENKGTALSSIAILKPEAIPTNRFTLNPGTRPWSLQTNFQPRAPAFFNAAIF